MESASAGEIARLRVPVVAPDDPLERARDLARVAQWDMAVVVSGRGIERWLRQEDLEGAGTAGQVGGQEAFTVSADQDVDEVARWLDRHGLDRALVTDDRDRLVGVVFRADIEGRARAAAEGEQERAPDVQT